MSCLLDSKHLERWGCTCPPQYHVSRAWDSAVLTHCCVHWWILLGTLHVLTALQSQGLLAPRISRCSFLTPVPLHVLYLFSLWSASSQWATGSFVSPRLCIGFLLRWNSLLACSSPTQCPRSHSKHPLIFTLSAPTVSVINIALPSFLTDFLLAKSQTSLPPFSHFYLGATERA